MSCLFLLKGGNVKGTTHVPMAIATNLVVCNILGQPLDVLNYGLLVGCSTFGGLLPDIDHAGSQFGSKVPIVAKLFKHRGFTHTVWFALITYILLANTNEQVSTYIAIGCISHIIGDILTPMGLRPFKILGRFDIHICIPIIQNELIEKIIATGLYIVIPFLIVK